MQGLWKFVPQHFLFFPSWGWPHNLLIVGFALCAAAIAMRITCHRSSCPICLDPRINICGAESLKLTCSPIVETAAPAERQTDENGYKCMYLYATEWFDTMDFFQIERVIRSYKMSTVHCAMSPTLLYSLLPNALHRASIVLNQRFTQYIFVSYLMVIHCIIIR